MSSLRFIHARLKNSSPQELFYRARLLVGEKKTRRMFLKGKKALQQPPLEAAELQTLVAPEICGPVDAETIRTLLEGFRFCLNTDQALIHECEGRLQNIYHGDIRPGELACDIRSLWEPARLQHLTLMVAWLLQKDSESVSRADVSEYAHNTVMKWLTDNPFLSGPHYLSAMECGLRITAFFFTLKHLDCLTRNDRQLLLEAIYDHAWWIERRLSLYSSLGNHTVCECVGLVFAGAVYRRHADGRRWLKRAINLLHQELHHQILNDGGPAEQSFAYHRFVLDQYWLVVDLLESNCLHDCTAFKERLQAGENFLHAYQGVEGLPAIGDSDDGHAIAPGLFPKRHFMVMEDQQHSHRTFSTSGYTVVRGKGDTLLTFDHGPLGMSPLYNHGHADALSVTLSICGTPFLVDCGTYRYNGIPSFRRYFKGTRAHNTVTVDGLDQAVQATGFIWAEAFSSNLGRVVKAESNLLIEASHDGYCRLARQVRHFRSIKNTPDGSWVISDHFLGSGLHTFEINYHFHPAVSVMKHDNSWLAECNGHKMMFKLSNGSFSIHKGEENPPLGWFSPAYNVNMPSPVLQAIKSGAPSEVKFETRITICE